MTLLDEIKQEKNAFADTVNDANVTLDTIYTDSVRHINKLYEIIVRHSQPLTPEQVVEWMGLEWDEPNTNYYEKRGFKDIAYISLHLIGLRWYVCIQEDADAEFGSQDYPLSRFHNLDELKSFVRILTGEEV